MKNTRGRISAGSIVMLVVMAVVVLSTFAAFVFIRGSREDLAMDAGRLVSSIGDMIAARSPEPARLSVQATVVVVTPVPGTPAPTTAGQSAIADASAAPVETPANAAQTAQASQAPQSTQEAQPVQTAQAKPRTLTLTFGGKIAYESAVAESCRQEGGENAYTAVLAGISGDVHADLNIAFMPMLLSADSSRWSDNVAPADSLSAIFGAGFDYLILSSVNSLENGVEGVENTLSLLEDSGISCTGLFRQNSTSQRAMIQVNGIRIAILSYQSSLKKASRLAVEDEAVRERMVPLLTKEKAVADIKAARADGANLVLVTLLWGEKDAEEPTKAQRETAQALCDAGADIIIGSGSDALLPVDMLSSAAGDGHQTLTAWSLGTLLSEARDSRAVVSSALLHVQLGFAAGGGTGVFNSVQYTPTYAWRQEASKGQYMFRVIHNNQTPPENMIQHQREVMGRALTLVQTVMKKGAATPR